MIRMRVLSEQGIEKFWEYIQSFKDKEQMPCLDLNVAPYSYEFQPPVEIEETRTFTTRMEMGEYITRCLSEAGINRIAIIRNRGFWTWLAWLWFEQLCPVVNGRRRVREMARYICSSDYTDYYRHYVAASYDIYSLYGSQNSGLFLHCPLYIHNDFMEQLASRQYIISNRNLIEASHRLYWNVNLNRPKRGSTDRNKLGSLRRLVKVLGQLELTYDIYSMTSDEVLKLLPEEFNGWKNSKS